MSPIDKAILTFSFFSFMCGLMIGRYWQDKSMLDLCRSQMKRGDYWFDRYMMTVRDDWTPLEKDDE